MMKPRAPSRQGGFILILSLVMLVAMTILATAAIRLGTINLRAVNNQQVRDESIAAAQQAIEQIVSTNFSKNADSLKAAREATPTITLSNDKAYNVAFGNNAVCLVSIVPLKNTELDLDNEDDAKCYQGKSITSACARTVWQVSARTTNNFFGAGASVTEAFSIKMDYALALGLASLASNICN